MSNLMHFQRSWSVTRALIHRLKYGNHRHLCKSARLPAAAAARDSPSPEPAPEDAAPPYPTHIPTSAVQRAVLAVGSAVSSLANPARDDMVATLGEVTGTAALRYMRQKMINDPVGRTILEEQPLINTRTVDVDYLRTLPEDTFGKAYANFLDTNGVSPDSRYPVQFVDDVHLAYVMRRYREVHDLLHTLLGMPTNMLGEVVVKWVEGIQLGLPLGILGGLAGPLRLGPKHRRRYLETHLWWALRVGYNAKFLLNVYYEKHWELSIHELRADLNIEEPPDTPRKMK